MTYADIAANVATSLTPDRIFIIGHSMGGAVGLLTLGGLKRCQSIVSVEGNLVAEDCGLISRQAAGQDLTDFVDNQFPVFLAGLRGSPRRDLRTWGAWYGASDPVAIHAISRSLVQWSDKGALAGLLKSAPHPAYLYGTRSTGLRHLTAALDGVPTHPISGSGHFPMIDQPDLFYRLVSEHLAARRPDEARLLRN